MINKEFFRLWILSKLKEYSSMIDLNQVETVEEAYMIKGKIDLLKELFDEYNLEDVHLDSVELHNNF
jgi:hypothetical protein